MRSIKSFNPWTATIAGLLLATAAGASPLEPTTTSELGETPMSLELAFMTHLDMDLPEQDVFVEREPGSGRVWRVTKGDNDMTAPLYKTAIEVDHDPFNPEAVGPHPKGEPLGMTLGQWLRHQGTGTYTCEGGEGHLETSFTRLLPNSVYTN